MVRLEIAAIFFERELAKTIVDDAASASVMVLENELVTEM